MTIEDYYNLADELVGAVKYVEYPTFMIGTVRIPCGITYTESYTWNIGDTPNMDTVRKDLRNTILNKVMYNLEFAARLDEWNKTTNPAMMQGFGLISITK